MAFKSSLLLAMALVALLATHECLAAPLGAEVTAGSASRGLTTSHKWWCEWKGQRYESWKGYSKDREYYWNKDYGWCCYDWKSKRGYWSKSKCSS